MQRRVIAAPESGHGTMYVCATVIILAGGALAYKQGAPPFLIFLLGSGLFVGLAVAVNCFSHRTQRLTQPGMPPELPAWPPARKWEERGGGFEPVRESAREPVDALPFREVSPAASGARRFVVVEGGREP
jgi:hypothetical protein